MLPVAASQTCGDASRKKATLEHRTGTERTPNTECRQAPQDGEGVEGS
jgi:hypothetical protein